MIDIEINCQFCGNPITRSVQSGMTCENYCTDKWVRWDRIGRPNYQRYLKTLGKLDEALEEYAKLNDLLFKDDGTPKFSDSQIIIK